MNYWKRLDLRNRLTQKRWTVPLLVAVAVAVLSYVLAVRYLFPYPEFQRWIQAQFRNAGLETTIEGLGPGPFLGVKARSLVLAPTGAPAKRTELRDVRARLSLLGLVLLRPRIALTADAMGGAIAARYDLGSRRAIRLTWRGVELARAPVPPDVAAIGLRGRSTGSMDIALSSPDHSVPRLSGTLSATVADAKLGPGSLSGLPLPGVNMGTGQFQLVANAGRIEVRTAQFEGGSLNASFSGTVELPADSGPARVDGTLALRPIGKTAEDLAFLFAFFPGGKSSDGTYRTKVSGQTGALVLAPLAASR